MYTCVYVYYVSYDHNDTDETERHVRAAILHAKYLTVVHLRVRLHYTTCDVPVFVDGRFASPVCGGDRCSYRLFGSLSSVIAQCQTPSPP